MSQFLLSHHFDSLSFSPLGMMELVKGVLDRIFPSFGHSYSEHPKLEETNEIVFNSTKILGKISRSYLTSPNLSVEIGWASDRRNIKFERLSNRELPLSNTPLNFSLSTYFRPRFSTTKIRCFSVLNTRRHISGGVQDPFFFRSKCFHLSAEVFQ